MGNFIKYFKDTFGKMIFVLLGILSLMYFGSINDIMDGNGTAGIISTVILTLIYIVLFVKDYQKWKKIK